MTRQPQQTHNQRSDVEVEKRRDDAVRRALNTPPKPLKEWKGQKEKQKAKPTASEKKP